MAKGDDGKGHAANAETGLTSINCALVVEDEFIIAEGLRVQLQNMGIEVCGIAASADDAIDLATRHQPGLVLMDMRLKGEADGVDAALAIYARIGSKVIFITGSREQATIDRIALDHAAATLFKPVSSFQLRRTIEQVVA